LPLPKRSARRALTPRERRGEVVRILSTALARMPPALQILPEPPSEDSPESSQKALEVSRNPRLSVTRGPYPALSAAQRRLPTACIPFRSTCAPGT